MHTIVPKRNCCAVVCFVSVGTPGSFSPGRDVVDSGGAFGIFREAVEPHKSAHGRPRRQLGFVLNWLDWPSSAASENNKNHVRTKQQFSVRLEAGVVGLEEMPRVAWPEKDTA